MMRALQNMIMAGLLFAAFGLAPSVFALEAGNPVVRLLTSEGDIDIELNRERAPVSVENFLTYVREGVYDNTIFHRVIKGFMIQGGGFEPGMKARPTHPPIRNEADNALKNRPGTVAMARTNNPHSATSQFFINTADNAFLDHRSKTPDGWGYAVFGKVIKGMDVVRQIENVGTSRLGNFNDVPNRDVTIIKAQIERE